MKESEVYKKSKRLAIRIVNLYKYLTSDKNEYTIAKQILRCGTSIGANLAEANCACSTPDFLSKAYIAFKECSETIYWLELLKDTKYLSDVEFLSIYSECNEVFRMLSSITKTVREKSCDT